MALKANYIAQVYNKYRLLNIDDLFDLRIILKYITWGRKIIKKINLVK